MVRVTSHHMTGVDHGGRVHRHRRVGRAARVCVRRQPAGRPEGAPG